MGRKRPWASLQPSGPVLGDKQNFSGHELLHRLVLRSARRGDCSESVPALCGIPFAGILDGPPNSLVWIIGADNGQKSVSLPGLPGLLAREDRSEARIVIQRLQIGFIR